MLYHVQHLAKQLLRKRDLYDKQQMFCDIVKCSVSWVHVSFLIHSHEYSLYETGCKKQGLCFDFFVLKTCCNFTRTDIVPFNSKFHHMEWCVCCTCQCRGLYYVPAQCVAFNYNEMAFTQLPQCSVAGEIESYLEYQPVTTLLQCFDTAGWIISPVKISSSKWPILCRVGR